jgi:hypothetical protein
VLRRDDRNSAALGKAKTNRSDAAVARLTDTASIAIPRILRVKPPNARLAFV